MQCMHYPRALCCMYACQIASMCHACTLGCTAATRGEEGSRSSSRLTEKYDAPSLLQCMEPPEALSTGCLTCACCLQPAGTTLFGRSAVPALRCPDSSSSSSAGHEHEQDSGADSDAPDAVPNQDIDGAIVPFQEAGLGGRDDAAADAAQQHSGDLLKVIYNPARVSLPREPVKELPFTRDKAQGSCHKPAGGRHALSYTPGRQRQFNIQCTLLIRHFWLHCLPRTA